MGATDKAMGLGVIALLGAGAYLLITKWEDIKNALGTAGDTVNNVTNTLNPIAQGENAGKATLEWMKGASCWLAHQKFNMGLTLDSVELACLDQAEQTEYHNRLIRDIPKEDLYQGPVYESPCALDGKGGFICPDKLPTDTTTRPTVDQEDLDAAMDRTNALAADLRASMYPGLDVTREPGAEYTDPLHACINGRKTVTRDEAIWPEMYARYGWDPETSDKLLFRNGCGMEGDGYGNGRYYCECD